MATFTVRAGIHNTLTLANSQVVIIGRNKWLKCLKFNEKLQEKLANRVDKKTFEEAINLLEQSSRIPLFFNYAQVSLMPFFILKVIYYERHWLEYAFYLLKEFFAILFRKIVVCSLESKWLGKTKLLPFLTPFFWIEIMKNELCIIIFT